MNNLTDLLSNNDFLPAHADFQLSILYILELAVNQLLELHFSVATSNTIN